jgi:hypothetical protein
MGLLSDFWGGLAMGDGLISTCTGSDALISEIGSEITSIESSTVTTLDYAEGLLEDIRAAEESDGA